MSKVVRIDHVAMVVDDLEATLKFWRDGLGLELGQIEEATGEHSTVAFLPVGGSEVELVQPSGEDSGLRRYLEKRGPGMHHLCLEVDDIDGMIKELRAKGIQMINESAVSGADGRKYAFIHPKSANGVMVELYELRK